MAKGVLYKMNDTTWSKSQAKKTNNTSVSETKVRHSNDTTWYDNYPMEQLYTETFYVQWTQPYNGSGTKLDYATWGVHPRSGESANFQGLFGFDRTAMRNFVANGQVKEIKFTCRFDDPSHAGDPVVNFCPHVYTSKPSSWSSTKLNKNYKTSHQFDNVDYDYTRNIYLPVGAWLNGDMGGIAIYGTTAAANGCRFAGNETSHNLSAFSSKIEIEVLK